VGSSEVSLSQDSQMMRDVSRAEIGQRANGERIVTGDPAAHPGLRWKVAEEQDRGGPQAAKLLEVAAP